MNLHPFSFQFYKCNPIKTFECIIKDIDTKPAIYINEEVYIKPTCERDDSIKPIPMPTDLLKDNEWDELLSKADFESDIKPLFDGRSLAQIKLSNLTASQFAQLSKKSKVKVLPYIDQKLRDLVSLRPIISVRQKQHYQRG